MSSSTPLLHFFHLTYPLSNDGRVVRVSASLESGGILAIRGPSGAGKSTLLKILARLQAPEHGEVFLQGRHWQDYNPMQWRCQVHYLDQKPALFDGTVLDNLQLPFQLGAVKKRCRFDLSAVREGMARLSLPTSMLGQDARTLSGGETARVALLRALILEPQVLLLDEPTAALDERSVEAVRLALEWWLMTKPHRGAVLVSHAGEIHDIIPVSTLTITPGQETEVLE